MGRTILLVAGLILLLTASSCRPIEGPNGGLSDREGLLVPHSATKPEPEAAEGPGTSIKNVALLGSSRASAEWEIGHRALDDDLETSWSSLVHPLQSFTVVLDQPYLVNRVELIVSQAPAGLTSHALWLAGPSSVHVLYKNISEIYTEDGQELEIEIHPPRLVSEVKVVTVQGPSWVAWREVRVFGNVPPTTHESNVDPQFMLEPFVGGLDHPVFVTHAGDESGRLFVLEQEGRIRIVRSGELLAVPFLDISDHVSCCSEQGLYNVAFPPSFPNDGRFYVSYTNATGQTVLSRFRTADDPDIADVESEEILLLVDQPDPQHNGGWMVFGPKDGYLYVGIGDGGTPGPPAHAPQHLDSYLGKILRLDVESGVLPYSIPAGNPFTQNDEVLDEIWAFGFRNPWGFSFDSHSGDLFIPDTGHNDREELSFQPASSEGGENYGWPGIEGTKCMEFPALPIACTDAGTITLPVAQYDHGRGCAIVGGTVYRGRGLSLSQGVYVFADFCRGSIWALKPPVVDSNENRPEGWDIQLLVRTSVPVSSIGEDEQGNVFVVGYADGVLYRLAQR